MHRARLAQEGDIVTVGQCRPLSKTVRFNVLKVDKNQIFGNPRKVARVREGKNNRISTGCRCSGGLPWPAGSAITMSHRRGGANAFERKNVK